jgi:hypothetical protein
MVGFIDAHRDAHGVEPICDVLPIAPSTYYDHLAKRADPARLSERARRDEALRPEIRRVFEENWSVYGVRKIWHQLRREGFDVARCTVARLMKDMDIQGIIRGKPHCRASTSLSVADKQDGWFWPLRAVRLVGVFLLDVVAGDGFEAVAGGCRSGVSHG